MRARGLLLAALVVLVGACRPVPLPAPGSGGTGTPALFVDPWSSAARQADAWRSARPADAAVLDRVAAQPTAAWFGDWNADVAADVDRLLDRVPPGAVAVLVAYNIPNRDCGGLSGGGAPDGPSYRRWVRALAQGIAGRRSVVVLEPDALALTDCLASADRDERTALVADAVAVLEAGAATDVYVDAGHARWVPAAEMAARLRRAGVAGAAGFSLNVSNFGDTDAEVAYGNAVSAAAGGARFVVDTSRNGRGPGGSWCNPPGRALGPTPTLRTGRPLADAFLWVKPPGESDGPCNGGPAAGAWWPEAALSLARAAGW